MNALQEDLSALVVVAQPKQPSFNGAIAAAAYHALESLGYQRVTLIDLYHDGFDPVMPPEELPRKFSFDEQTLKYQEKILQASRVVFIYPDWWGGPPAILKGFLDRVFRPGIAYGFKESDFRDADAPGLFGDKRFDIFITTDAKPEDPPPNGAAQRAHGQAETDAAAQWPPAQVWKKNILAFCGVTRAEVHVFWNLRYSTFAERKAWLDGIAERLGLKVLERVPHHQ